MNVWMTRAEQIRQAMQGKKVRYQRADITMYAAVEQG